MAFVYLLHFAERYPNGQRPQHYLGVTDDIKRRMTEHKQGSTKSRLMAAVKDKGIAFVLAEVWVTTTAKKAFEMERKLKRRRKHKMLCPVCKGIEPAQEYLEAMEGIRAKED